MENAATIGRIWFQYRSFSPIPLFFLVLALPAETPVSATTLFIGVTGIVIGELIRLWAVGFAGSATRTRGDQVPSLVHAGPYLYVRNPLYIGNIILYTMVGILGGFKILTLAIFLYSSIQYAFIVLYEESILAETFGREYEFYQRIVPRWLPLLRANYQPSQHDFSWKKALRSERSTLLAITAMGLLLITKWYLAQ